jgi:HAD superfamily hydrolase (TIGR01549 family)
MRKPKALMLDLDNTLFDSEKAYDKALRSLGLSLANPRYLKARQYVKSQLPPRHVSSRNRLLYFKTWLSTESRYSPQSALRLTDRYERSMAAELRRQWRALRRNALFSFLTKKFPIVILSNENTRAQLVKLAAVDPGAKFFERLVTSEEMGAEKPDRRMFDAARRILGVPYRDCWMIGDSFNDDIRPALALGMQAVLTREFSNAATSSTGNFLVIDKLDQLKQVLP